MPYVVIENTPGYLPDDDDPYVSDDLASCADMLRDMVARICEHHDETEEPYTFGIADDGMSAYVIEDRPHALGRVIEILPTEETT